MNRSDIKLIVSLLAILGIYFLIINIANHDNNIAIVYYENKIVLKIDLNDKSKRKYEVNGYNGIVSILTVDGKVKVVEEKSPKHLCSKQGYISKSYESIICLPNKITIKIENNSELDTIVR